MPRIHRKVDRLELLDSKLSELTALVKDICPLAEVEISFEQYEDEDAHIAIHPPVSLEAKEVERLENAFGIRCNDILVDTGLFIIGAVQG